MDTWEAIEELATGTLRGDEGVARQLFNIAAPGLLIRALRRRRLRWITREAIRDEVGQDCLGRVWEKRRDYRGTTVPEFYGWFNMICDSRAADAGRRVTRGREETAELSHEAEQILEAPAEQTGPRVDFDVREALEDCLQALRQEDPEAYDVISLLYVVGAKVAEINRILARPRSTVYEQRSRAHKALADCLERKGITEG